MAIKISSAHYGWICGVKRDAAEYIVGVAWTKRREAAKPYREGDEDAVDAVRMYLYGKGIAHDIVHEYVPWVDG